MLSEMMEASLSLHDSIPCPSPLQLALLLAFSAEQASANELCEATPCLQPCEAPSHWVLQLSS